VSSIFVALLFYENIRYENNVHSTRKVSSTRCTDLQSIFSVQDIVPSCRQKNKHTLDNLRGKCPTIVPVFFTATAYRVLNVVRLSHTLQHSLRMQQSLPNSSMVDLSHTVEFLSWSNDVTLLSTR